MDWNAAEEFCENTMKGILAEFDTVDKKNQVEGGFEREYRHSVLG